MMWREKIKSELLVPDSYWPDNNMRRQHEIARKQNDRLTRGCKADAFHRSVCGSFGRPFASPSGF